MFLMNNPGLTVYSVQQLLGMYRKCTKRLINDWIDKTRYLTLIIIFCGVDLEVDCVIAVAVDGEAGGEVCALPGGDGEHLHGGGVAHYVTVHGCNTITERENIDFM